MDRARTRIHQASKSEPWIQRMPGATEFAQAFTKLPGEPDYRCVTAKELASRVASRDAVHEALLAKAVRLLSDLLPYAGESYDSMTNVRAKHCLRTAEKVSEFLYGK